MNINDFLTLSISDLHSIYGGKKKHNKSKKKVNESEKKVKGGNGFNNEDEEDMHNEENDIEERNEDIDEDRKENGDEDFETILEGKLEDSASTITKKDEEVENLTSEMATLKDDISKKDIEISTLKEEMEKVVKEKEEVATELATAKATIEEATKAGILAGVGRSRSKSPAVLHHRRL